MNFDQLEAILAVVEQGSFRAAAVTLKRSQPALSATIKNLEEEFGILIFDRSDYRPKLTEAGNAFLAAARTAIESAHYAARVAIELGKNKAETKLQISVDPLISLRVIDFLIQECTKPLIPVTLVIDKSILKGSYKLLIDGKLDLAIATCPHDEDRIEKVLLENVTLVGAVAQKLLGGKQRASEKLLSTKPQILVYDKAYNESSDDFLQKPILKNENYCD